MIHVMPYDSLNILKGYHVSFDFILNHSSVLLCYFDGKGGETSILLNRAKNHVVYNLCKTVNALDYGHFNWKGELTKKKNRINHGK